MPMRSIAQLLDGNDWWDTWDYPNSIVDQCFATHLTAMDVLAPSYINGVVYRPRTHSNIASSGKSEVQNQDKQFQVTLDVSQFKPEELEVKVVSNYIVVHGKHEEKSDDHGFVARQFTRRYMLPKACEMETVSSSMSPSGILTIAAPKKTSQAPIKQERDVPITKGEDVKDGN